ncbi:TPA: hypothetical protein UME31_004397 [Klebsiella pneumoniae]|nr:hypothetical protein [Klebsiella pneumoniae]
MSDLIASLNGGDRDINADTLFGVCDRFFLVEMKSYKRNVRDEAKKPAVCLLCNALQKMPSGSQLAQSMSLHHVGASC